MSTNFPHLIFCGQIGSGKSSLARSFAAAVHGTVVSFGAYIEESAKNAGLEVSRTSLADHGKSLLEQLGMPVFVRTVLATHANAAASYVFDGVRDANAIVAIRNLLSPARVVAVYVDTDRETRLERIKQRARDIDDGAAPEALLKHEEDHHSADELRQACDIVVDGRSSATENVAVLMDQLK